MPARSPGRLLVPALFAAAAATTGVHAGHDLSHAVSHPGTRAWLIALYSVLRTCVALAFAVFTVGRTAPRRPSRSPLAFIACAAALTATIGFGDPGGGTPSGLIMAGELVAIAFALWLLVSVSFLGRCFGILPEARGLVTKGPYRLIRHPVYLGEIGACAGLAIAAPSPRNTAAVLTVLGAQLVRMRLEERALTEAFPAYAEYAARTPRLLPRFRMSLRGAGRSRARREPSGAVAPTAGPAPSSSPTYRFFRRKAQTAPVASRSPMRRIFTLVLAVAFCVLGAVAGTQAAVPGHATAKHRKKAVRHPARVHGLRAPGQVSPANGAHVQQTPALTWSAVPGAAEYEYQLAADSRFRSIVLGSGPGRGTSTTHNLAAALSQRVPDGTYYWRVRGLTATKEPGAWSSTRTLVKTWSEAPQLLAPAYGSAISWPSEPLVLNWTPVQGATEYIVSIASDPGLSNLVLGTANFPQKTDATVFALPTTLHAGTYYWAITPVDAEGHRGARSTVATFAWYWPTGTTLNAVANLNPEAGPFDDPQFSWSPVAGAAKYEVEINSAVEFPVGSKWCCNSPTTGTALAPLENLANNGYYWRVRAVDPSGNAGEWNYGAPFTKAFDSVSPSIPNLTLANLNGEPVPAPTHTDTPIVTWSPVSGAGSYEVQVAADSEVGCEWNNTEAHRKQTIDTSSLAWTPLGEVEGHVGPLAWPAPRAMRELDKGGTPYCVRVLARADHDSQGNQVTSEWTYLAGNGKPAFYFEDQPAETKPELPFEMHAGGYVLPQPGSRQTHTPLFTWQRVPGATSYYVVIARDAGFTNVIDVASTEVPAYAPQLAGEEPLDDETTGSGFYWAVIPARKGVAPSAPPGEDSPQGFFKSSNAPTPLGPVNGTAVSNQPTFSWTPAEGAVNYTLQVSQDPTFGNPIDNVRTDATAYTSSTTYPANVTLFWRVRANDANSRAEGLHWSEVQTFRRTLPVPSPAAGNPSGGQAIPVLSWTPVTGAIAYEMHVEQPDGTTKDFTVDSTSFTPTEWYGTGIWHWQVRAAFPTSTFATVPSAYFAPQAFVHTLAPPTGVAGAKSGSRIVISWNPDPYAKEYEVEVATNDTFSFSSSIDSRRVEGTSWAPDIDLTKPANKGTLYWRVAAADSRGNLGPYAEGRFTAPRAAARCRVVKVTIKSHGKRKTVKRCAVKKKKHG